MVRYSEVRGKTRGEGGRWVEGWQSGNAEAVLEQYLHRLASHPTVRRSEVRGGGKGWGKGRGGQGG